MRSIRTATKCQEGAIVTISVVQWTTGNVGKESVKAIIANPDLELVGCYAWSDSKVGVDVGELVRHRSDRAWPPPTTSTRCSRCSPTASSTTRCGCRSTNSSGSSRPGVDVVTTAAFITGGRLGADRDRLADACERGRLVAVRDRRQPGLRRARRRHDRRHLQPDRQGHRDETADTTFYDSPDTERPAGFGQPIDDPDLHEMAARGHRRLRRGGGDGRRRARRRTRRDHLRVRVRADHRRSRDGSWTIPAGHVAGVAASWQGRVGGRTVVDLNVRWKKGTTLEPDWIIEKDGWVIRVDGLRPSPQRSTSCHRPTSRPRRSRSSWRSATSSPRCRRSTPSPRWSRHHRES